MKFQFQNIKQALLQVDSRTIYLYAFLTGLLTGAIALLFHFAIHQVNYLLFDHLANFPLASSPSILTNFGQFESPAHYSLVWLFPAIGGLLTGLGVYFFGSEAQGTGIDHYLDSFHNHAGQLLKRTPILKFMTSLFTLGSGGSAGKEGPMALIGAGIGSLLGKVIKMGARARRTLFLSGAAGGLGAIFRAPLGGAITAVEVLYKDDFESDALIPCIISSVTAYTLFSSVTGFDHNLQFDSQIFHTPIELIFYAVLGLLCAGAAFIFIRLFRLSKERIFNALNIKPYLLPMVGGLLVGTIGLLFPKSIGEGMAVIQQMIDGKYPAHWLTAALFLLGLAVTKMFTTTITIQSGGSGGALIPSMFIGASLGGAFGLCCNHFFPTLVPSATPFIIVGMAAFFSAVTNASLGALVMVTELTGSYELLPPLMIVAVISLITSNRWSLYSNQVPNKFSSRAHLWDMNPINLQHVTIQQAFATNYHHTAIIPPTISLADIQKHTAKSHETDFIVATEKQQLVGLLSIRDLDNVDTNTEETTDTQLATDLISRQLISVSENESLYRVLKYVMDYDFDKVPVVAASDSNKLLGYLRYRDILNYYYKMGLQKDEPTQTNAGTPSE